MGRPVKSEGLDTVYFYLYRYLDRYKDAGRNEIGWDWTNWEIRSTTLPG